MTQEVLRMGDSYLPATEDTHALASVTQGVVELSKKYSVPVTAVVTRHKHAIVTQTGTDDTLPHLLGAAALLVQEIAAHTHATTQQVQDTITTLIGEL